MNKSKLTVGMLGAAVLFSIPSAFAATDAECTDAFMRADTNKDGMLSEAEAGRYYASMRVMNAPITDGKLTRDAFMTHCKAGDFTLAAYKAEVGAPFSGANSFTQNQAKDRIIAAGYTDVSGLAKDANGVWRGNAMQDGKKMSVAVDYKGNVVVN